MNRYNLRFQDKTLEKQYEQSQFEMYRNKSNYYFLLIFLIICILQFVSESLYCEVQTGVVWKLLNISLILFTFIFHCKFPQFAKQAIFLETLILISQKIEHVHSHIHKEDKITNLITLTDLEYHLHILQVFDVGCLQIALSLAQNIYIETLIGSSINTMYIINYILCAIIKLIATFFFQQWSRQQFTLFLKDQVWQQQLPNIIQKPFFKFTLDNFTMQFNTISCNQIQSFPSFNQNFCNSCNLRQFLRSCIKNKTTLEQKLLNDYIHNDKRSINNNQVVQYLNNFKQFTIRICNLNAERFKCLIILEQHQHQQKQAISNRLFKKNLLNSMTSNSKHISNKFFRLGLYTILSVNDEEIGMVNIYRILKILLSYYSFLNLELLINQGQSQKSFLIKTYTKKLIGFMTCIFNIFVKLNQNKNEKITMNIQIIDRDILKIQIYGINPQKFLELYNINLFLVQAEKQLLLCPIDASLKLLFSSSQEKGII